ncbi:uncharacterized protein LOC143023369 [Oratosquilla oratoria]|uniref:uncharacterized protein LOC143023369 n=1 Tax=Oratosquilla oratoria TaxID=337810 RepID=UPI003F767EEF
MVVIGDVNGHVGSDRGGVENVIGAHGIGNRNREGERVIDFCTMNNNLSIMNTFYKHRPSHQWTWYRWNDNLQSYNDKFQIDLVITNNKKIFRDVKAIPSVSLDSDHRLVVAKINARKWRVVPGKIRRRFKVEDLKNPKKKESFKEKIRGKVTNLQTGENINEEWEQMKTVVKEVAEEVLEMKYVGKTKKKRTPWWTEEMADAVKEKMKKFRKWMKFRTAENRENYVEERNKCNRVKRESKAEVWQKIGNDLREDMEGTRELLYNMARNYRKEKNEGAYAVQAAIQRMKNGKACGEDEIHIEFIKAMGELGANWLTRIMNVAWKNAEIPDDWSKAVVCPIFKKDDRTNCNNYRGISLLSHVGKVYERVIERRLRMAVEERFGEWQHGFRPQRSTVDIIFTLKMVLEKNREWNIDKFAIFIDMEKAFDKVPREEIWRALEHQEYDVPANLKRAIKSIYRKCENKVKLRGWRYTLVPGQDREDLLSTYTLNIPSDGAVNVSKRNRQKPSVEARRNFMTRRIQELKTKNYHEIEQKWANIVVDPGLKEIIEASFHDMMKQYHNSIITASQKKLVNPNAGNVKHPRPAKGYVNLTDKTLTPNKKNC